MIAVLTDSAEADLITSIPGLISCKPTATCWRICVLDDPGVRYTPLLANHTAPVLEYNSVLLDGLVTSHTSPICRRAKLAVLGLIVS